jgi:hypothetical protein
MFHCALAAAVSEHFPSATPRPGRPILSREAIADGEGRRKYRAAPSSVNVEFLNDVGDIELAFAGLARHEKLRDFRPDRWLSI